MGKLGFTDMPTKVLGEDSFGISSYIKGLSNYIEDCTTPMTIAIQGDWGSGKTSVMYMVQDEIKEKAVCTWFNTWQYSQFNMGDELAISLIQQLIKLLDIKNDDIKNKANKIINTLKKAAKIGLLAAIEMSIGSKAAEATDNALNSNNHDEYSDISMAIGDLKGQFSECVKTALKEKDKDRVVIFVDDLDRLNPQKAVELLEVLKLFLDCENCVFVLAIDYHVVLQGVKEKYGNLIDEEKGRAFFDKIIQVPFKMPVALYNIDNYVKDMLNQFKIESEVQQNTISTYVNLIKTSIGFNPRAMKRLFNAYLLLQKIYTSNSELNSKDQQILFAILCIQLSYENFYNFIIKNKNGFESEMLSRLSEMDYYHNDEEGQALLKELNFEDESILAKMCSFMKYFLKIVDADKDGNISEEEANNFIKILNISTVTSSNAMDDSLSELDWEIRRYNRNLVKKIIKHLEKEFKDFKFRVYQSNNNRGDGWLFCHALLYHHMELNNLTFHIALELRTNIKANTVPIYTKLYGIYGTTGQQLIETFGKWASADGKALGYKINGKNNSYEKYEVYANKDIKLKDEESIFNIGLTNYRELFKSITKYLEETDLLKI